MKEDNPYESPSVDPPADAVSQREHVSPRSGCLLPFVSLVILLLLQEVTLADSIALRRGGLAWLATVVQFAPHVCLIAWLVIFYVPIGRRLRLAPLRAVRRIPASARHLVLWVALICAVIFVHYLSAR